MFSNSSTTGGADEVVFAAPHDDQHDVHDKTIHPSTSMADTQADGESGLAGRSSLDAQSAEANTSDASLPSVHAQISDLQRRLGVAFNIRDGAVSLLNALQPESTALREQIIQELASSEAHTNSLKLEIAALRHHGAGSPTDQPNLRPSSTSESDPPSDNVPAFGPGGWGMAGSRRVSPARSDLADPAGVAVDTGASTTLVEPKSHWLSRSRSSPQLPSALEKEQLFSFDLPPKLNEDRSTAVACAGDTLQHAPSHSQLTRPCVSPLEPAPKPSPSTAFSPSSSSEAASSSASSELARICELLTALKGLDVNKATSFDRARILTHLSDMLYEFPHLRDSVPLSTFLSTTTAQLSEDSGKGTRARAYRALRLVLSPPLTKFCHFAREHGFHWYIVRTFLREAPYHEEREQALMLVRALIATSRCTSASQLAIDGPVPSLEDVVDMSVMRGLIAICCDGEDSLHLVCVETLAEIAMVDSEYFLRTGSLHPVITAIADHDLDIAPALMRAMLSLLDMPASRYLIHPGIDLEPVLAAFTDPPPMLTEYEAAAKLKKHAKIIATMFRSWTGLMYLCLDNRLAIRSLITAIQVYPESTGDILLDELTSLAERTSVSWCRTFKESKGKDAVLSSLKASETAPQNLMDHFIALLLYIMLESGLVDALVNIIETSPSVRAKATHTLSEVLRLSNLLLPARIGQQASTLPRLFSLGSNLSSKEASARDVASTTLATLDKLSRDATPAHVPSVTQSLAAKRQAPADGRKVDKLQQQALSNVDDNTFRSMLAESQVNNARDPSKWNVDILVDLLEGVLVSPRRFDEVMRQGRFVRRLCSYYHPMARRFSSLAKTRASRVWARLGTQLIRLLMKHPDGLKFLVEDPLLSQIGECLAYLDTPHATVSNAVSNGSMDNEPLFSRAKLGTTVVEGYFEMLGVISTTKGGLALLERFRIFTQLHRFVSVPQRDYIVRTALQHLSFDVEGHARVLLSHALTAGSRATRLFATSKLAQTLQSMPAHDASWNPSTAAWMVELLVAQLYDTNPGIQKLTIELLGRVCDDPALLELVIAAQPSFDHLGEAGHALMLKFLSLPSGFAFLNDEGFVADNLARWFNDLNFRYSLSVELLLSYAFEVDRPYPGTEAAGVNPLSNGEPSSAETEAAATVKGVAPCHFYAQLTRTQEGVEALKDSGHFDTLVSFIQQYGLEAQDGVTIAQLKSMLWAVGNIGATERGIVLVESYGLPGGIITIAEQSPVISVRGVAFFVLGLFARTHLGSQLLSSFGWESVHTQFFQFKGIAIPSNLHAFEIESWRPEVHPNLEFLRLRPPNGRTSKNILDALAMMGNSVLVNKASMRLGKLRTRYPWYFACPTMRAYVLAYLHSLPWKQSVRRFVWELFDIRLDPPTLASIEGARSKIVRADRMSIIQRSRQASARPTALSELLSDLDASGPNHVPNGAPQPYTNFATDYVTDADLEDDESESDEDDDGMLSSSSTDELEVAPVVSEIKVGSHLAPSAPSPSNLGPFPRTASTLKKRHP